MVCTFWSRHVQQRGEWFVIAHPRELSAVEIVPERFRTVDTREELSEERWVPLLVLVRRP